MAGGYRSLHFDILLSFYTLFFNRFVHGIFVRMKSKALFYEARTAG
jgi:hypothetical protein